MLRKGDEWLEVGISNVSQTGMLIRHPGKLPVGESIEIRRRGVTVLGEVVWSTSTRFGMRSHAPIDLAALLDPGLPARALGASDAPKTWTVWHWRRRD